MPAVTGDAILPTDAMVEIEGGQQPADATGHDRRPYRRPDERARPFSRFGDRFSVRSRWLLAFVKTVRTGESITVLISLREMPSISRSEMSTLGKPDTY